MSPRPHNAPTATALRVADLSQGTPTSFKVSPDQAEMTALAAELGLSALRKLSFSGRIVPQGKTDWQLEARLGATVVQPCIVTLEPVTSRIDVNVVRRFIADYVTPDEPESEMPEDDNSETLGAWIDPGQVMRESLALEIPDYPRKDAAELGAVIHTEPGHKPMTDADARPFAGLAGLRQQLKNDKD